MSESIFYEPVSGLDELQELEMRWRRGLTVLWRWLWAAGALAMLLVALNLVSTAFDPGLPSYVRAWSTIPLSSLALLLAPFAARNLWLRRRALAAQLSLLGHRGLLGRESDVHAAEERIAAQLSIIAPADPDATSALAVARRQSRRALERLGITGLGLRRAAASDGRGHQEERRLIAHLDIYAQILGTAAVDAALDPTRFANGAGREAIERALAALDGGDDRSTRADTVVSPASSRD